MVWAASDPRFRDAEGLIDTSFCLWVTLALLSQAAALQLIDAGRRDRCRSRDLRPFCVCGNIVLKNESKAAAARLRQAFFPSGAKDDRPDAELLLDLLTRHRDRPRPLEPHTVETRTLQFLVEERRHLVDEKTRQKNRLTAQLKPYFPQVLAWFDDLDAPLVGALLKRWPTLEMLQRARPATVLRFWEQHHSRSRRRNQQRLEAIRRARPATQDGAVISGASAAVGTLLGLIGVLRQGIGELDRKIRQLVAAHEGSVLFNQLPGAGPALAPRLLAAFGTRRERFQTAAQWQAYSGVAPVVVRSGQRTRTRFC